MHYASFLEFKTSAAAGCRLCHIALGVWIVPVNDPVDARLHA